MSNKPASSSTAPSDRENGLIEAAQRQAEVARARNASVSQANLDEPSSAVSDGEPAADSEGSGQLSLDSRDRAILSKKGQALLAGLEAWGSLESRYELVAEVARGGMGAVYRARQKDLAREVAIKVGLPDSSVERFLREAKFLAQIDSPYVVRAYDFARLLDGTPVLVMEWVDGTDLLRECQSRTGLPLAEDGVLRWMGHTAEALLAAHDQGIIHRDLKPSNILIDRKGRARVVDFGLARTFLGASDLSLPGSVMGTPFYMAPEQAEDPRSVDTRADVYSFGATFYHALTGRPPFEGETAFSVLHKHKTEPLVSPKVRNPSLSKRTSEILERCLAKSPQDRFPAFTPILECLSPRLTGASPWEAWEDPELARYLERYQSLRGHYLRWAGRSFKQEVYKFPEGRMLRILNSDIAFQQVDAIVSSDDEWLSMGSGVSSTILQAAGRRVFNESRCYIPVRPGRAVVTSAGVLPARFVFHGSTLGTWPHEFVPPDRATIAQIIASCFYHADTLNVRSMAFPLLGAGAGGFPRDVCLDYTFQVLARNLLYGLSSVKDARIVIND